MTQTDVRGRPRLAVKLLVVACGVAAGLLIFELFLRAAGYTYPVFYAPHETRGWALRPGVEGWYRREGASYVRINGDGLRDREHEKRKPANVIRVALLGDSYAEAFQVEQDAAFWRVAEGLLNASCGGLGGRKIEFVNFGVSGYGTAQQLFTLREQVWAYEPDVVLLTITTNNDLIDNTRVLKDTNEIPYFVFRGDELTLDDSFRQDPAFRWRQSAPARAGRWLREHLRFVQAVHHSHTAIKTALAARRDRAATAQAKGGEGEARKTTAAAPPPVELGVANMIYEDPSDDTWRGAWRVTEALIAVLHREVRGRGARFVAVTLSNPIQVHPDASARAAFMQRLGVPDLFYPERRFQSLGHREGFPILTIAPEMQAHADRTKTFLHGFGQDLGNGHWNESGHRLAGQLLAEKLCAELSRQ